VDHQAEKKKTSTVNRVENHVFELGYLFLLVMRWDTWVQEWLILSSKKKNRNHRRIFFIFFSRKVKNAIVVWIRS